MIANSDHVAKFNEGPTAWNKWRRENNVAIPEISGGSLEWKLGAGVGQYDLTGVTLSAWDLPGQLDAVNFRGALLQNVNFTGQHIIANFSSATLTNVNFDDCLLWNCKFSGATLKSCFFRGAKFAELDKKTGLLKRQIHLTAAEFENVHAIECDFQQSSFSGISIWRSQFVNSDLRGATGMVLDDNVFRDTLFSPYADNDWAVLRRHYTGANMVFLLLASLIFFLPWALDAAYWANLGRFENKLSEKIALAEALVENSNLNEGIKDYLSSLSRRLVDPDVRACYEDMAGGEERISKQCRPVWQILLGWHEEGFWAAFTSSFLLLFNVLRLGLTWLIAPLRDEENRSSHTPPRNMPPRAQNDKRMVVDIRRYYGWMMVPHYVLLGMLPIALILGLFNILPRLFDRVWVF